jgi:hypothetical protein
LKGLAEGQHRNEKAGDGLFQYPCYIVTAFAAYGKKTSFSLHPLAFDRTH